MGLSRGGSRDYLTDVFNLFFCAVLFENQSVELVRSFLPFFVFFGFVCFLLRTLLRMDAVQSADGRGAFPRTDAVQSADGCGAYPRTDAV